MKIKKIKISIAISVVIYAFFYITQCFGQETDEQKMEQALEILNQFKEQTRVVDPDALMRLNDFSYYQSSLKNAVLWTVSLLPFAGYEGKVEQYERKISFEFREEGRLSEKTESKIKMWANDKLESCKDGEEILLRFINDAINACNRVWSRACSTGTMLEQEDSNQAKMQAYFNADRNYKNFTEEKTEIQKYYPDIYEAITEHLNKWKIKEKAPDDKPGLPPMS